MNIPKECENYNECMLYFIKNLPTINQKQMEKIIKKVLDNQDRKRKEQDRRNSGSLGICSIGC